MPIGPESRPRKTKGRGEMATHHHWFEARGAAMKLLTAWNDEHMDLAKGLQDSLDVAYPYRKRSKKKMP